MMGHLIITVLAQLDPLPTGPKSEYPQQVLFFELLLIRDRPKFHANKRRSVVFSLRKRVMLDGDPVNLICSLVTSRRSCLKLGEGSDTGPWHPPHKNYTVRAVLRTLFYNTRFTINPTGGQTPSDRGVRRGKIPRPTH